MDNKDIRWEQRFFNYKRALEKLSDAVKDDPEKLSELEREGLIQRFEYTFELAWKTLQDILRSKGYNNILGPVPVIQQAFSDGYISSGEKWKEMKRARDMTSHVYDEQTADEIIAGIINDYCELLLALKERLEEEISKP